jgi:hypothetical protein
LLKRDPIFFWQLVSTLLFIALMVSLIN